MQSFSCNPLAGLKYPFSRVMSPDLAFKVTPLAMNSHNRGCFQPPAPSVPSVPSVPSGL